MGLSRAHVLGDFVSASDFINMWGSHIAGQAIPRSLDAFPSSPEPKVRHNFSLRPSAIKMTQPVGDHWLLPRSNKMGTHHFHVALDQLRSLLSARSGPHAPSQQFPLISAVLWKTLAKIRGESEPKIVPVCTDSSGERRNGEILKNGMVISSVEVGTGVAEAVVSDLAELITEKTVSENGAIEELVGQDASCFDGFF